MDDTKYSQSPVVAHAVSLAENAISLRQAADLLISQTSTAKDAHDRHRRAKALRLIAMQFASQAGELISQLEQTSSEQAPAEAEGQPAPSRKSSGRSRQAQAEPDPAKT